MAETVKVNVKYQITIPQIVRKQLNIQKGDCLIVDVQDGHGRTQQTPIKSIFDQ